MSALGDHGPCPEHRRSFANVTSLGWPPGAAAGEPEFGCGPQQEGPGDDLPPISLAAVQQAGAGSEWSYG
jgi:hypothetical protein